MNRISPTVLGILVIVGGVCAALPFQRRATRHVTVAPATNSETIEWRSNDFTLEVVAHDQPLTDSPYGDDRPSSPAFGGGNGATITSPASLDNITQPPALAGTYDSTTAATFVGTGVPRGSDGHSGTTPGAPMAVAATPPRSVAITHKIVDGDTLEALAEVHLGSRSRWTEIYNANPEILDNPEVLPLGVTIVILPGIRPSRPANSPETEALVPVLGSDLLKFRNAID
jgi:phage tail protein X